MMRASGPPRCFALVAGMRALSGCWLLLLLWQANMLVVPTWEAAQDGGRAVWEALIRELLALPQVRWGRVGQQRGERCSKRDTLCAPSAERWRR
jgi:hypothetical protein